LHEEIDEFMNARFAGGLSALVAAPADVLDGLPLLESGMRETLRLFSAFLVVRLCTHDTVLHPVGREPLRIMEGEMIFSTPRNIHMDPDVYSDPETFKLDRYLEEDEKAFKMVGGDGKTLQGSYIPWGGGEQKVRIQPQLRR
jgi:cytochrome P450